MREICREQKARLAADVLIASDGPRLAPERPTIFLGARGAMNFSTSSSICCRGRAWYYIRGIGDGLLARSRGIVLAHALASITSDKGAIKVREWVPSHMPNSVRMALADCTVDGGDDAPEIDLDWGEPGLTARARRCSAGAASRCWPSPPAIPENPVNAIPPKATATCQIRFVVGVDPEDFMPAPAPPPRCARLPDGAGRAVEEGSISRRPGSTPTMTGCAGPPAVDRADHRASAAGDPAQSSAARCRQRTSSPPILGLPTVWIPHSYASCSQHAPNEHMLAPSPAKRWR